MSTLPAWIEPTDLEQARLTILSLGRSLHEHAYLIGKALAWVKAKLRHGEFGPWVESNLWFSQRTAQRFLGFALECDGASSLLEYKPGKNDIMADLKISEEAPVVSLNSIRAKRIAMAFDWIMQWEKDASELGCRLKCQQLAERHDSIAARMDALKASEKIDGLQDSMEIGRELGRRIRQWHEITTDLILLYAESDFQFATFYYQLPGGIREVVRKIPQVRHARRLMRKSREWCLAVIAQGLADWDEDAFNWGKYGLGETQE